jgi:thioredoxin reductase
MSQSEYRNYWLDTVTFPRGTATHIPHQRDVVIIGAGFTGLSAALHLAKRGLQVAVFEEHTIGFGASSRISTRRRSLPSIS